MPGLLSREVGSFLRNLVNGGEDLFVGEDLQRAFYLQAAFKATRFGAPTTTTTTTTTRLGEGKLEEPRTEVPVRRKYTMKRKLMRRKVSKISSPKQRDLCGG